MKVGDLVRFANPDWLNSGGVNPNWGFGLIEEALDDGTFRVFWTNLKQSATHGPKSIEVINESR